MITQAGQKAYGEAMTEALRRAGELPEGMRVEVKPHGDDYDAVFVPVVPEVDPLRALLDAVKVELTSGDYHTRTRRARQVLRDAGELDQ